MRNVIVLTSEIGKKWYKLGIALCIPIPKMEIFHQKYSEKPVMALNRVYRYWLANENGLSPTWEKLVFALQGIKEFEIAAEVELFNKVSLTISVVV